MPALNFQKQFVELIESGAKRQTIRAVRKDGRPICRPGDRLKLYTGMRQKNCRLVKEAVVLSVAEIEIRETGFVRDGVKVFSDPPDVYLDQFAKADGFESWSSLTRWFREVHGLPFRGWLIEWEDAAPPRPQGPAQEAPEAGK